MNKLLLAMLVLISLSLGTSSVSLYRIYYPLKKIGPTKDTLYLHNGHIILEREHIMLFK